MYTGEETPPSHAENEYGGWVITTKFVKSGSRDLVGSLDG